MFALLLIPLPWVSTAVHVQASQAPPDANACHGIYHRRRYAQEELATSAGSTLSARVALVTCSRLMPFHSCWT